jgi:hypothetical protein
MPPRRAKTGQAPEARRLDDPRAAAQALRRLLGQRVEAVLLAGNLDKDQAEELAKIGSLLEKLEQGGYDLKAAALEVGARLVDFVAGRPADPAQKAWLADLLDAFYLHLDQGA